MKDYYKILGVPEDASPEEIREAFYKLAHKYHPDKGGDPEKFKEINEAYQVLSDKEKRAQYDQMRKFGFEKEMPHFEWVWREPSFDFGFDLDEIFEEFFGFGRRKRETKKGKDIEVEVEVELEDVLKGKNISFSLEKYVVCPRCQGTGGEPGTKIVKCEMCRGTGEVQQLKRSFFGTFTRYVTCPACHGEGVKFETPCSVCHGEGRIKKKEEVFVSIPKGVDTGHRIKIKGGGDAGKRGGKPGDLIIFVYVKKHPIFERKGDDLFCRVDIPLTTALLGGEILIPTLEGKKISIEIPPGTRSGEVFKISNQGLPHYFGRGRGDLYCQVEIKIPKKLTKEQKDLINRLRELGL